MKARQESVTTTAELIASGGTSIVPQSVVIKNTSATAVFLGGDDTVSNTTGFQLAQNESISLDLVSESVWAITATGTATLHVIQRS